VNENFVENVMADLQSRIGRSTRDIVDQTKSHLQKLISVPVDYIRGPRGGLLVIRSKPGEPPRKETGRYQGSWGDSISVNGDIIEGSVYSDVIYGSYLVTGTKHMAARPHTQQSFEYMIRVAPEQIGDSLKL
jgi:hypothetical protein